MTDQRMRKATEGKSVTFQENVGGETSFAAIVPQADVRSKYRELRAQAQAEFLAYRQAGGELDAVRWMYHHRPDLFNLWVNINSPGGHHDARPFGRTRADGARMVRRW